MNKLAQEIEQSMLGLRESSQEGGEARFLFPPEFIGFKGHFPERPVLPGVCKIQATLLILKIWRKKKVTLKEIVLAKFFSPVVCGQEVTFTWRTCKGTGEETLIKVLITSEEKKIAQLQLKVHFSHEDEALCAVK